MKPMKPMKPKNAVFTTLLIAGILLAACSLGKDSASEGGDGLPPPSKVTVEGASSTSIALVWTAVSGAAKYKIYTSVTSTGIYRYVDETEERRYVANDLVPASTYYYKVSAVDISGIEGPQSTYAEGATKEQPVPVPGSVNASALSSDSIQVNWNRVAGAASYKVYRSASASDSYTIVSNRIDAAYIDTGLPPLTTYYYRVSAVTSRGESDLSVPVYATTPAEGVVPAPGNVQAALLNAAGIQISWNAVPNATSYRIYRGESAFGSYTLINSGATLAYTDTELSPATTYYYRVSAVHSTGESEQSYSASATTPAESIPIVYNIGDTGPAGGFIFYDKGNNSDGWRYLEAASRDAGSVAWGTFHDVGRTGVEIGTGKQNTETIINYMMETGRNTQAAMTCRQYSQGGYSDWFLPSKAELNLMYWNLKQQGKGSIGSEWYWSSSQESSMYAWRQRFSDGTQSSNTSKDVKYSVRAVRQF